ncbi:putative ubiquinone biosynthesis monooxygenase, partial [Dinochytrium kinnereticum]
KSPSASKLKIALIDSAKLARDPPSTPFNTFSNRVSSVTPESVQFLKALGAWDHISDDRKKPYSNMKVWDAQTTSQLNFTPPPTGSPRPTPFSPQRGDDALAWIIENSWLLHGVARSLGSNVTVMDGVKVLGISMGNDEGGWSGVKGEGAPLWPVVGVEGGRRVGARVLVGADGANSIVRRFANIESVGWDYAQQAVVATMKVEACDIGTTGELNVTAYQRFLKDGPIALLPLSDDTSSLVWSTTPSLAQRLVKLPAPSFATLVDLALRGSPKDLEYLCGAIESDGTVAGGVDVEEEVRWSFERGGGAVGGVRVLGCVEGSRGAWPLRMRKAGEYVLERVALVGDAAHTIHPLAGQGLNLGLSDAKCLADVMDRGVRDGQDI